jgi:hypothetical protein
MRKMKKDLMMTAKGKIAPPETVAETDFYSVAEIAAWVEADTFAEGARQNLTRSLAGNKRHSPTD